VVLALDASKGLAPVLVAKHLFPDTAWMAVAAGMLAILGHSLSVFLRFRGGKGVATGLGVFMGLDFRAAGIAFALWLVLLIATRYVSIASMTASIGVLVLMHVFDNPAAYRVFAILAVAVILVRHRSNIARLLQGKEARWGEKVKVTEG
jgi:glycerol-3-phosphate acyltransferase PlsY